ncbi:peptide MFS transporter [Sphingomonas sp.]|uniref:peptide MFS transporter n=1 Tax=Sphingomonas sp. TaxID=28214 RepID=UPI00286BA586|nr:peptide MFS transporter [Sphingomonas sp.]
MTSRETIGGHPRGLYYLAFTELWERFSYYGMTALLTLYMVKQLLLPGHAENVLWLDALRQLFEFRGPMSNLAFASLIYGWYGGLVYFTPILGGLIADRLLGAKRTVVIGALLMAAGHLAMSFDASFLIALLLLILGSGCLKGNISAQVGTLYPQAAASLRDRGFTIFSTGINIGSVIGPLATVTVAEIYGWHAGFALAAGLMLLALAIYLAGQRHLPEQPMVRSTSEKVALTPDERRRTRGLIAIILLVVPVNVAYPMIWSIGIVWIDQHVRLTTAFGAVPAGWFNALDSFGSIIAAAPLVALWAAQATRNAEPASITKLAIGSLLMGLSILLLTAGSMLPDSGGKVSVWWAIAAYLGAGLAFMWFWPVTLSTVSALAPRQVRSTLMGGSFIALFLGTVIMGWVGSFYDQMEPATFWTVDASIAIAGAALIMLARRPLERMLRTPSD